MPKRTLISIGLTVLLVLSGCATSGEFHTITFGAGHMAVQNGTFEMDGNVSVGIGAQPQSNFSDVTVILIDSNREAIQRIPVRNLSTDPTVAPLSRHVNVTTDRIPEYVVIRSPSFWTTSANVRVHAYRWTENGYKEYYRSKQDQLFPD